LVDLPFSSLFSVFYRFP